MSYSCSGALLSSCCHKSHTQPPHPCPSTCNCAPVHRTTQNCSIYFQGVCPNSSARLPIHAQPPGSPLGHLGDVHHPTYVQSYKSPAHWRLSNLGSFSQYRLITSSTSPSPAAVRAAALVTSQHGSPPGCMRRMHTQSVSVIRSPAEPPLGRIRAKDAGESNAESCIVFLLASSGRGAMV